MGQRFYWLDNMRTLSLSVPRKTLHILPPVTGYRGVSFCSPVDISVSVPPPCSTQHSTQHGNAQYTVQVTIMFLWHSPIQGEQQSALSLVPTPVTRTLSSQWFERSIENIVVDVGAWCDLERSEERGHKVTHRMTWHLCLITESIHKR